MEEIKYFFSYTRKDSEFVLKLAKDLREAGVNLWLDQLDILGGREWDREVEGALKNCRGMIAVLSPESVASDNVMNEVSYALEEGRLVVPVLFHPCDKPFRLRRLQHIDFTTSYDTGLSQLLRALGIKQPSQPPERSFVQEVTEPLGDRRVEPPITEPPVIRTESPEPETPKSEPIETKQIGPGKPKPPEVRRRNRAVLIGVPAGLVLLFLVVGLLWFWPRPPGKPVPGVEPPGVIPFPGAKPPETTTPKTITNEIGMKFVLIPPGTFQMGSDISKEETAERYGGMATDFRREHPQHPVNISRPFYMQTTEVTQEQWQKVMDNNPSDFKECGKNCPVENVSWNEAQKFIQKLNRIEKTNKYRLPTEAEWEYACRAGKTGAWCFGYDETFLKKYAWYKDNSEGKTYPVGRQDPNGWGIFDMHGNVWEWCQDYYGDYEYSAKPVPDPQGPPSGKYRVLRGGSYYNTARSTRSAHRNFIRPDLYESDDGFGGFGFRVAKDL